MDLWLTCNVKGLLSVKYNNEYQVIDINPKEGYVKIINEFNNGQWYREDFFKKAKKEEVDVIMEKQFYGKIDLDLNVVGRQLTASVKNVDRRLPDMRSMNIFLGVQCPWGIDIKIIKAPLGLMGIELTGDNTVINGLYGSNTEALDYADKARKAINYFNDILSRKEVKLETAYVVRFSPTGKKYTFRSVQESIKVGDTVVCKSLTGDQYAVVCEVIEIDSQDWHSRAYCRKL